MNVTSWHSYPKIYNIGHRYLEDLLKTPVLVEEKVDGSQFSFGVFDGELKVRSRGQELCVDAPEKMFASAVESVKEVADRLLEGHTYRGEYLQKPKHNSLTYSRIPRRHIILFDINRAEEDYLSYGEKAYEAERLGFECVPALYCGMIESLEQFMAMLDTESVLGGVKIEGVVVKPVGYGLFGQDKKCLMGKFVSEAFKEVHKGEWKVSNPGKSDVLDALSLKYATEARWQKAVQHASENGVLDDSPKDIGTLIKLVPEDIKAECEAEIKEQLFKWAWPNIARRAVNGLPEWYKQRLLERQFE